MENKIPKVIFEDKGMGFLYTVETLHRLSVAVDEISEVWYYMGFFVDESDDKHHFYMSSLYHYIGELDINLFLSSGVVEFIHSGNPNDLVMEYLDK